MMEIRTNQGLAYNVGSHFDVGRRFTGSFTAETETKAEATAKTIGLMTSIIAGVRKEPVTEQELSWQRSQSSIPSCLASPRRPLL
jgi:zinc protease